MGIDIYMEWVGITSEERKEQIESGFSLESGHTGYLRESYFRDDVYVTKFLVREAFESPDCVAGIPASVLRQRLPMALKLHKLRVWNAYREEVEGDDPEVMSFVNFVQLAEKLEEEGKTVRIIADY